MLQPAPQQWLGPQEAFVCKEEAGDMYSHEWAHLFAKAMMRDADSSSSEYGGVRLQQRLHLRGSHILAPAPYHVFQASQQPETAFRVDTTCKHVWRVS